MPRKICEREENRREEKKSFCSFSWKFRKISPKMCIKLVRGSFWKKSKTDFAHCRPLPACQISRRSVQKWRLHNFFSYFAWRPMKTIYINIVGKRRAAESDNNSFTSVLVHTELQQVLYRLLYAYYPPAIRGEQEKLQPICPYSAHLNENGKPPSSTHTWKDRLTAIFHLTTSKESITSKIKHAIKLKTNPARLAQLVQPSLAFCF